MHWQTLQLAAAGIAFVGTHLTLSHTPVRSRLLARLGEFGFLGLYSLVAFACLGWMILAYGSAPRTPLWVSGPASRLLVFAVMPVALYLVVAGARSRNPMAVHQEARLAEPVTGVLRITRHPVMWGLGLWAATHVLANGDLASLVFFGAFVVLAMIGAFHIDARRRASQPDAFRDFAAVTSFLPFAAARRNGFGRADLDLVSAVVAVVLYVVLIGTHRWLSGVPLVG